MRSAPRTVARPDATDTTGGTGDTGGDRPAGGGVVAFLYAIFFLSGAAHSKGPNSVPMNSRSTKDQ